MGVKRTSYDVCSLINRKMGARNSKQRTTPFLIPWRDLEKQWQDVDRVMVEVVPSVLRQHGYYIYRMKEDDE